MSLFFKSTVLLSAFFLYTYANAQDNMGTIQQYGTPNTTATGGENLTVSKDQQDLFNQAAAREDKELRAKTIDLRTVLATGLNKNIDQRIRNFERERLELNWKDDFQKFWFPDVNLNLTTGDELVQTLRTSSTVTSTTDRTADGALSLDFGEYSVFNWGRDYLEYQNNKTTFTREKQKLSEQRRALRFQLISNYFNLVALKRIQKARREQLRHTSFIHRLARQKLALKKIRAQEYYLTRAEYLRAQTLFQQSQADVIEQDQLLADLLGDDLKTTYKPTEELKFLGINTSRQEALKLALSQSPEYRQARTDLDNANRSFQKVLKDNMPLPEIKLNLGAYRTTFDNNGRYTEYEGSNGNRDVELVASINMTWNIVGEGGLFNSRTRKRSYLDKRIAEEKFKNSTRAVDVGVRTLFRRIRFLERKTEVSEVQLRNAQAAFDATLDNYISAKTNFANLKIVLDRHIEANINYELSKYDHLVLKLRLADLMGLEDFPGANFENLAEKI